MVCLNTAFRDHGHMQLKSVYVSFSLYYEFLLFLLSSHFHHIVLIIFTHLYKIVEAIYFHCSLSPCVSVCVCVCVCVCVYVCVCVSGSACEQKLLQHNRNQHSNALQRQQVLKNGSFCSYGGAYSHAMEENDRAMLFSFLNWLVSFELFPSCVQLV